MTDTDRTLREKAVQDGTWMDLDSYLSWQAAIEEIGKRYRRGEPIPENSGYFRGGWKWIQQASPYSTGL